MSQEMKKQIPILTSNFATLIAGNGYYVDKTGFIQKLESLNFPNIFFLRPRRFGKSLHLSMIEYYYGIQHKDKFNELFGDYYIGKPENFTPLKNCYYILNFNFSGIKTQEEDKIEKEFNSEISSQILSFLDTYSIGSKEDLQIFKSEVSSPDLIRKFLDCLRNFYLLVKYISSLMNTTISRMSCLRLTKNILRILFPETDGCGNFMRQ